MPLYGILDAAIDAVGAEKGNIQIVDPRRGVLRIAASRGFEKPFLDFFREVRTAEASACGQAFARAKPIIVDNVRKSPIFAGTPALVILVEAGVAAVSSVPLKGRTGQIIGMLSTHFPRTHRPTEDELRRLDPLLRRAVDLIETEARPALAYNCPNFLMDSRPICSLGQDLRDCPCPLRPAWGRRIASTSNLNQRLFDLVEVLRARGVPASEIREALARELVRLA
jgi:hypothetical protein